MSFASALRPPLGKRPGKQNRSRLWRPGKHGGTESGLHGGARRLPLRLLCRRKTVFRDTTHAGGSQEPAAFCFLLLPHASPAFAVGSGKHNGPGRTH